MTDPLTPAEVHRYVAKIMGREEFDLECENIREAIPPDVVALIDALDKNAFKGFLESLVSQEEAKFDPRASVDPLRDRKPGVRVFPEPLSAADKAEIEQIQAQSLAEFRGPLADGKRVEITLDKDLLAEVDAYADKVGLTRSVWIANSLRQTLNNAVGRGTP